MKNSLPTKITEQVKQAVYIKADAHGYGARTRSDNSAFMDSLVTDADVGCVLKEYMDYADIRTYIKDGILNYYAKQRSNKIFANESAIDTLRLLFDTDTSIIHEEKIHTKKVYVCRSENGKIFVVSDGTVSKWETALRKALDIIAREPGLTVDGVTPTICLQLADVSKTMTDGDKKHISTALSAISVKARFFSE